MIRVFQRLAGRIATASSTGARAGQLPHIEAKLVWKDPGYGERAEVVFSFIQDYPQVVLRLGSYAVAHQLAAVLTRIVLAPAQDSPPPDAPTA